MSSYQPINTELSLALMEITKKLPDAVCVIDEEKRILFANESTFSFLSLTQEDLYHLNLASFYPEEVQPFLESRINHAKKHGFWRGETIMTDKTGVKIPVSQIIISHDENTKDAAFYSTIIQEVESLKTSEIILAEQQEQLQLVNDQLRTALHSKDEFLANMGHELRTPLNAILGMTETLLDHVYGSLNEDQHHCLKVVEESGHHLLSLINDILDIAKIDLGKLTLDIQPFDLKKVCQSALDNIIPLAEEKKVHVSFDYDDSITLLLGDGRRIKEVLVNLLKNAVKFSHSSGRIGLVVLGINPEEKIRIEVWDMGIGINKKDIDRIFEPYQQVSSSLDRHYDGSGLGLPLSKGIIDLHQGDLSIESVPGEGSIFTLHLPWKKPLTTDPTVGTGNDETNLYYQDLQQPIRILLAEDNAANIETFQLYLESKGFIVETALTGTEAISKAISINPALILMDVHMPELDGLEAIQHLKSKEHTKNIPIIALTALAMPQDQEKCLTAGADYYLSKPIRLHQLYQKILETLHKHE
ncbi:PAS domain S-box-containing protein [Tindallia magadiensis]|uniref:Stage 0 sporulation protein A homolog n=1 Tax=Tindallia magadiensis TaxID=69895 RepID=A0A1I3GAG9_9FIRM|nr:ATP-binding protein [Tindallia magadiensis]SFI20222.1 PAS domain S-box-containing protein [Tindallia magadiensis]